VRAGRHDAALAVVLVGDVSILAQPVRAGRQAIRKAFDEEAKFQSSPSP